MWSLNDPDWRCKIDEGLAGLESVRWSPDSRHVLSTAEFQVNPHAKRRVKARFAMTVSVEKLFIISMVMHKMQNNAKLWRLYSLRP